MAQPTYMYQTLQVDGPLAPAAGPSARGTAVGAGVKLLHKASKALNQWAISYRVNSELEKMAGTIERTMLNYEQRFRQTRPDTGVLVVVGVQEWERPDPTGARAMSFLSIHIAGAGSDPGTVLQQYLWQPRMVQGAPKGWRRKDAYIWVTRN